MKLSHLLTCIEGLRIQAAGQNGDIDPDTEIGSIHYRAQDVRPGGLFVAIRGLSADGHDFISTAKDNGAAAVVVQKPVAAQPNVITVSNTRMAMGDIAACFYDHPSDRLFMIGITGTNGKTTTAYLVESILSAAGLNVGVIGTINTRYAGRTLDNPVTTPESLDLQRTLLEMQHSDITHVVMEVSSHGIQQQRIRGCRYDVALFTNLSQDHLDFHGTMQAYWNCKQRLFTEFLRPNSGRAVINCNDTHGAALAKRLGTNVTTTGYDGRCSVQSAGERYHLSGITADILHPSGTFRCRSRLVGRHNLENILCAVGAGTAMGIPATAIRRGIDRLTTVPGRLEPVPNERHRFVFVDYAHTPDALENTLLALRSVTEGRIISVFGCGGDRDTGKRSQMGEIGARKSDLSIITSDNPRCEEPLAIIDQVLKGVRKAGGHAYTPELLGDGFDKTGFAVEPDRRSAIELSVSASGPGDTILIAGKGHETYQTIGERTIDFNDREVVLEALGR